MSKQIKNKNNELISLNNKCNDLNDKLTKKLYDEYDIKELLIENKLLKSDSLTNSKVNANPNLKLLEYLTDKVNEYRLEIIDLKKNDLWHKKYNELAERTTNYIQELEYEVEEANRREKLALNQRHIDADLIREIEKERKERRRLSKEMEIILSKLNT